MFHLHEWLDLFKQEINHIDLVQCAVLILGVAEVLLARANNIWLYPIGIAATLLSILSLYDVQLYAECMLNLYYVIMSVYGWWFWSTTRNHKTVEVSFASRQEWYITMSITFGGSVILFLLLSNLTNSTVPAWDAWVTATGWAGMWLLARRKIENWLLLNISNAFAIPLLFQKGLPLLAILTIFLFLVACKGYVDWLKIIRKQFSKNDSAI